VNPASTGNWYDGSSYRPKRRVTAREGRRVWMIRPQSTTPGARHHQCRWCARCTPPNWGAPGLPNPSSPQRRLDPAPSVDALAGQWLRPASGFCAAATASAWRWPGLYRGTAESEASRLRRVQRILCPVGSYVPTPSCSSHSSSPSQDCWRSVRCRSPICRTRYLFATEPP